VQAGLPRDTQLHKQRLQGQVCRRDSALARHVFAEKPKKEKPEALARFWQLRQGGGTLRAASFCWQEAPGARGGAAGTGLSSANKVLGKENCSVFCLPFEMLSLSMHKEIWIERTCQKWKNLTEIPFQKHGLLVGCLRVAASRAPGGWEAKTEQAEDVSSSICGRQKRCLCCRRTLDMRQDFEQHINLCT